MSLPSTCIELLGNMGTAEMGLERENILLKMIDELIDFGRILS